MKTFQDLVFDSHPIWTGLAAKLFFPNRYGVSVVRGYGIMGGSYTNGDEWELAVLKGDEQNFDLCYSTHITDDVIGHLSDDEVTEIMKQVQEL